MLLLDSAVKLVKAVIDPAPSLLAFSCNHNSQAPAPIRVCIAGGDGYINSVIRPYVEQFSAKSPDWLLYIKFLVIPLGKYLFYIVTVEYIVLLSVVATIQRSPWCHVSVCLRSMNQVYQVYEENLAELQVKGLHTYIMQNCCRFLLLNVLMTFVLVFLCQAVAR